MAWASNLAVKETGVDGPGFWVDRLSLQASAELDEVRQLVNQTQLTDAEDARPDVEHFVCQMESLTPADCTDRLLRSRDGTPVPAAAFVWDSCAPKRVQHFTWLLVQGRIQSRSNLLRKKIVDNAICEGFLVCNRLFYSHPLPW
ncbi:unnamed protein product [Miscanthus lutarioriparius]|uniref:Reverse transcriptase zinc-binding domain-containing protein n=1 Tax=Miscanthus lutarioriparius TaxID=422564 RepID=A0A811R4K3_9POAL|nr:unnamed protein product [Miscanthus lutarioriparius]